MKPTLLLFVVVALAAQTTPIFDVASVKPTAPENAGAFKLQRGNISAGTRVQFNNMVLRNILQTAYTISDIEGGPSWLNETRFDIEAKTERPVSQDDHRVMLRSLLAERFRLAVHTETRSQSVYTLVLASKDGTRGPNLRVAAADCATLRARNPPSPTSAPCGNFPNALMTGTMTVRGLPIAQLGMLGTEIGRPVVDRTGLQGNFDWDLTWTPQRFRQGVTLDRERFPTIDPDGPSIFTAIQEQLGLKLESTKDDRPVLIIDHVEPPTPD